MRSLEPAIIRILCALQAIMAFDKKQRLGFGAEIARNEAALYALIARRAPRAIAGRRASLRASLDMYDRAGFFRCTDVRFDLRAIFCGGVVPVTCRSGVG